MPDAVFEVKVQPKSSKNEILGFKGNILYIKLTAAPIEGEANSALLKLLSKALGVTKSDIIIIKGLRNRYKVIKIQGLSLEEVKQKLLVKT